MLQHVDLYMQRKCQLTFFTPPCPITPGHLLRRPPTQTPADLARYCHFHPKRKVGCRSPLSAPYELEFPVPNRSFDDG